jgi:UDP:flavonoid glycosyltransferase YjiC (YdhE family)
MRILLSASPALGDIIPLLPLTRAFRDSGDAVAFLVDESVGPLLKDDGIEVLSAGSTSSSSSSWRCGVSVAR